MDHDLCNTVFVVDDEKVNRAILSGLVRRMGFDVNDYASGKEALQAFERVTELGGSIAAIIMDINMPEMDGLEAAWRIRALEARQRQICSCQDAVVPSSPFMHLLPPEQPLGHCKTSHDPNGDPDQSHQTLIQSEIESLCERCKALRTPIWAVSACSLQEQAKSPAMRFIPSECPGPPWKLAGFDAFIPKPMQPVQLAEMLNTRKRQRSIDSDFTRQASKSKSESLQSVSERIPNPLQSCGVDARAQLAASHANQEVSGESCLVESGSVLCSQSS